MTLRTPLWFLGILFLTLSCGNDGSRGIVSSWVQSGPSGIVIARVITNSDNCPKIKIDGVKLDMTVRSGPDTDFPVLVCEADIPVGTQRVSVAGRLLKLPKETNKKLVIIGDTGCRLEDGDPPQSCNDPSEWPFKKVSESAAALEPDLVIHVGDYLYRENECPEGDSGCEGSPFGDNYTTWDADFFAPADKLLRAAPWVFSRGNHEECSRAGPGWFKFLDPNPLFPECEEFTPVYTVDIGSVELLILDSASAEDNSSPSDLVEQYGEQIDELEDMVTMDSWFLTHHPIWGIGEDGGEVFMINDTLQSASDDVLPEDIHLVLSGHIHFFEILDFEGSRPSQLIVGNSGTELDDAVTEELAGMEIGGGTVSSGISLSEFGFVFMEYKDGLWEMSVRDVDGGVMLQCELVGATLDCLP